MSKVKIFTITEIDLSIQYCDFDGTIFDRYRVDEDGNVYETWLVRPGKFDTEIIGKIYKEKSV